MRGKLVVIAALAGCGARPGPAHVAVTSPTHQPAPNQVPVGDIHALLSRPPDLVITLHPGAIARDAVYGPLLRRASELASAYAGPTNLGTTALAVFERTEEVVIAGSDGGKDAVVILRGVPADLDPLDIVDTSGHAVWRALGGDVRTLSRELGSNDGADAALFLAPGLVWIIASGPAIPRTRAVLLRPTTRT